ncbi:MAG: phospholipase A [Burkholderiales bacterium]
MSDRRHRHAGRRSRTATASAGSAAPQFAFAFPIKRSLMGYVQFFSGYGESLIDCNHRQNTLGIGVLLTPWQ